MKRLTEQFNSIAVKKGEKFMVDLEGNPSTGYLWALEVKAGDATVVSRETLPLNANRMSIGGGAVERTVFVANEAGTVEIEANWQRPWEKGKAPARTAKFKVSVS
jgi:predicted secreted protein